MIPHILKQNFSWLLIKMTIIFLMVKARYMMEQYSNAAKFTNASVLVKRVATLSISQKFTVQQTNNKADKHKSSFSDVAEEYLEELKKISKERFESTFLSSSSWNQTEPEQPPGCFNLPNWFWTPWAMMAVRVYKVIRI